MSDHKFTAGDKVEFTIGPLGVYAGDGYGFADHDRDVKAGEFGVIREPAQVNEKGWWNVELDDGRVCPCHEAHFRIATAAHA